MAGLTAENPPCYYAAEATAQRRQGAKPHGSPERQSTKRPSAACTKGSEIVEPMTNAELNAMLELLAKLVEQTAASAEDAARIIREAKA